MINKSIIINNLTKEYKLYSSSQDRVKEVFNIRRKKYHSLFKALNDVTFDVKTGETVGIIGRNGAGKSTLLKIITGVLTPTSGEINTTGRVSALLELGAGFNQEYTGIQNIYLNGRIMGYSKHEMDAKLGEIVGFAEIGEFINLPVKTYSSGMFARLAFAVAINVEPDILIVDEALSVGDLFFQNKCFRKFEELKQNGITILFVSHDISSVRQMCSRVLWLEQGQQKIFSDSDTVCDMYMDEKRENMNVVVDVKENINISTIEGTINNDYLTIPRISFRENKLCSEDFDVMSCFITDKRGNIVTHLQIDEEYKTHVVIAFKKYMKDIIVGFVFNNNKGLPLFDINNFINQEQVIEGNPEEITEVVFEYKMPRLMKGMYIVSTAIAQGTQENHKMLTWLHGVLEVEIINVGYNSSYIEIPSKINVYQIPYNKVAYQE